jgi:hypothetical protein
MFTWLPLPSRPQQVLRAQAQASPAYRAKRPARLLGKLPAKAGDEAWVRKEAARILIRAS